jgi:hypothetical protein
MTSAVCVAWQMAFTCALVGIVLTGWNGVAVVRLRDDFAIFNDVVWQYEPEPYQLRPLRFYLRLACFLMPFVLLLIKSPSASSEADKLSKVSHCS